MYQSCDSCSWPSAGEWFLGHWGLNQSYLSLGQMSCGTELHRKFTYFSVIWGNWDPLNTISSLFASNWLKNQKREVCFHTHLAPVISINVPPFSFSSNSHGGKSLIPLILKQPIGSHFWDPIVFAFSCFPQIINPQEECLLYLMLFCKC